MKKLILLCSLTWISFASYSSHLMGGQVTAQQISGLTYEVKLTVYRDTVGVSIHPIVAFIYRNVATGSNFQQTAPHSPAVIFLNGVEEYTYTDTVTFPTSGEFEIFWTDCCRNAAILNIPSPGGEDFAIINRITVDSISTNSSPVFLNPPVIIAQVNDTFYYNPLPFDVDGDSLIWSVDTPQTGSTISFVAPIAGYVTPSADPGGPFTMNSLTGEITWIPDTTGHFVASFIIEEFRNGTKIGEIRRDMQFIVIDLPGNHNRASVNTTSWPVNADGNIQFDLNPNLPFNLSIIVSDGDNDLIDVEANGEPFLLSSSAASWTSISSGPGLSENEFSWNPGSNEIRANPYLVTFRMLESHGNYTLVRDQTVLFRVGNFTSINENNSQFDLGELYPVPSKNELFLPVLTDKNKEIFISFVNQLGQEVKSVNRKLITGQNILYFNNLNFPSGIYFVNINIDGEIHVKKIIVE